jgi:hypothetical protein
MKSEQCVKQSVLSDLDEPPAFDVFGLAEIRNDAVVATGYAKLLGAISRDQPIAHVVRRIRTIAVRAAWIGQRDPRIAARL